MSWLKKKQEVQKEQQNNSSLPPLPPPLLPQQVPTVPVMQPVTPQQQPMMQQQPVVQVPAMFQTQPEPQKVFVRVEEEFWANMIELLTHIDEKLSYLVDIRAELEKLNKTINENK